MEDRIRAKKKILWVDDDEDLTSNPQLADIPAIVFTSLTRRWGETIASRDDALRSDAGEFVDKSAGIDVLISTIREYLGT